MGHKQPLGATHVCCVDCVCAVGPRGRARTPTLPNRAPRAMRSPNTPRSCVLECRPALCSAWRERLCWLWAGPTVAASRSLLGVRSHHRCDVEGHRCLVTQKNPAHGTTALVRPLLGATLPGTRVLPSPQCAFAAVTTPRRAPPATDASLPSWRRCA